MNETTTQRRAGLAIRAARVVPATPAEAWRVCTDAASMSSWWGRTEKGELFASEADLRVGGSFRFGMRGKTGVERLVTGRFAEVNPPHQLVCTWTSETEADELRDSRVSIEFMDLKDGSTRIVVTHEGLPVSASSRTSAMWHDFIQDLGLHFAAA